MKLEEFNYTGWDSVTMLSRYKMNHQPLEAKHHDTVCHVRIQGVNSWFGLR